MIFATSLLTEVKARAWIAALLLFLALIFRDALQAALTNGLNALGALIYERLAGSRLLRRRALARYRDALKVHCSKINVPFRPNRPLPLDKIYIDLKIAEDGTARSTPTSEVLSQHTRIVVKGPPGAGKSMFLRHTASSYLRTRAIRGSTEPVPVLLELHRLGGVVDSETLIEDQLVSAFERSGFPKARKFVRGGLDKGSLLILLDGLDEVPTDDRSRIVKRLLELLERYEKCPAIITCRTAVYKGEFDAITDRAFEIEPFRDQQIQAFLASWPEPMPAGKSPELLMAVLRGQPKLLAAARNPLLLTIMAHLYSDIPTYMLPRSRADFYRQAAAILLDQWQGQLNQNAFEAAEKDQVLRYFALRMLELSSDAQTDRRTLSREQAIATATEVMPRLGRDAQHVEPIIREIVERSGLLLKIDGGQRFAFAHLTFQEYFAAEGLLEQSDDLLSRFASDPDSWREVVKLWCGLATDCTAFVASVKKLSPTTALECVSEARALEQDVADDILVPATAALVAGSADEFTQSALAAVAADVRPRGDAILGLLISALHDAEEHSCRIAIAGALAASNRSAAAEALVAELSTDTQLQSAVVALGDLAVEALAKSARRDELVAAVECLGNIGTPAAARELVAIMVDNSSLILARSAACHIAGLLRSPRVQQEMAEVEIPEQTRRTQKSLEWVWAPFSRDATLRWIVGRAVALIMASDEPIVGRPHPIVSTAIAALDPRPLDTRLVGIPVSADLAVAANKLIGRSAFGLGHSGTVTLRARARTRTSESYAGRTTDLSTYRELVNVINFEALSGPLEPDDGPADEFVIALLDNLTSWPVWTELMRCLPGELRRMVLFRLAGAPKFNVEQWPAVAERVPYRFERSLRYVAVLFVIGALSLVAIVEAGSMLAINGLGTVTGLLAAMGAVSVVGTWVYARLSSRPSTSYGGIDMDVLAEAGVGTLLAPYELGDNIALGIADGEDIVRLITVGFTPALCWLVPTAGERLLSWPVVVALSVATAGVLALLIASGARRERTTRSPLMGLFVEPVGGEDDFGHEQRVRGFTQKHILAAGDATARVIS